MKSYIWKERKKKKKKKTLAGLGLSEAKKIAPGWRSGRYLQAEVQDSGEIADRFRRIYQLE
jgi:hypothetical protein